MPQRLHNDFQEYSFEGEELPEALLGVPPEFTMWLHTLRSSVAQRIIHVKLDDPQDKVREKLIYDRAQIDVFDLILSNLLPLQ